MHKTAVKKKVMHLFNTKLLVEAKDCYIKKIIIEVHKGKVL